MLTVAGQFALKQGHHGRGRGIGASHHVRNMTRSAQRILALAIIDQGGGIVAGEAHRPLDKVGALPIPIRTGLSKRCDRYDDQARIQRAERRVREADALKKSDRMVLDQEIGL